jgi:hypothetical protein
MGGAGDLVDAVAVVRPVAVEPTPVLLLWVGVQRDGRDVARLYLLAFVAFRELGRRRVDARVSARLADEVAVEDR